MDQLSDTQVEPAAEVVAPVLKPKPIPPEFLGAEAQIEKMRVLSKKFDWPIGERELQKLSPPPAELLPGIALVLEPEFGEHQQTMLALLDVVRESYRKAFIDSLLCDRELHYSNDKRPRGFFWKRLRVRGDVHRRETMYPRRSPSTAVLAFIVQQTQYVSRMNGSDIPYLWVPGFQVHLREGRPQPKTAQVQAPGRHQVNGRMRISYDRGLRGLSIIVDFFGGTDTASSSDSYTAIPDFF